MIITSPIILPIISPYHLSLLPLLRTAPLRHPPLTWTSSPSMPPSCRPVPSRLITVSSPRRLHLPNLRTHAYLPASQVTADGLMDRTTVSDGDEVDSCGVVGRLACVERRIDFQMRARRAAYATSPFNARAISL